MATWGTGLLASDSALDFLDRLAALPASERSNAVSRVLALAVDDPSSIMRDIVPEEVIAAAALVAASLPLTDDSLWIDDDAAAAASLPQAASPELVEMAEHAIGIVTVADGWWRKSWINDVDSIAADEAIRQLRSLLRDGSHNRR